MGYNSSGIYTRVDNSFSNPVVGTTISPTDADTYFDDIDTALNAYYGTSTTSIAIGTGSKTFTTQTGKLFTPGRFVSITSAANSANYMYGQVTSYSTTTLIVNVLATGGSGTAADWTLAISGARGADGKAAGHSYVWNTATSGDPGSGKLLGNNATLSSVTAINISETDNDGNSIASNIATWDDSTSTIHGRLKIYDPAAPTNYAYFDITGTNVDAGTYDTLTVSYVGSGGTLSNSLAVAVLFIPKGDKGDTGPGGALSPSGTPTVNQFAAWVDGTTLKGISITGLVKGNGASAPAAATAGTDYLAPPSGTALLKANSGGALANATAGTDYLAPGTTATLTVGFKFTPNNIGTITTGTVTPDAANGNYQYYTNNGAHTLSAPAADSAMDILVTNGASAGAITFSGFTVGSSVGDSLTTTNTSKFIISIRRINSIATYTVKALQ